MSSPQLSDPSEFARLLAEARAGSSEVLGRVLMTCREYLLLVADRKLPPNLRCKASPSDLVQETFLEVHRDFASFRSKATEEEWLAWLSQILLHNVANTTRRFCGTKKRAVDRELSLTSCTPESGKMRDVTVDTPTPSACVAADEDAATLESALRRLPEQYRRVLDLRYQENKTFVQIGETLSCSAEAARKLWARAVRRLQKTLESPHESQ